MSTRTPSGSTRRARPWWLGLALVVLLLAGCQQTGQMVYQPRLDILEQSDLFADGRSARSFVPGTVPYMAEGSPNDSALTGADQENNPVAKSPVKASKELVQLGMERYNIYCIPCHGPAGKGDGKATTFGFPKPPSLLDTKLTDGEIFNVITNGKGKMFSYGYRVKAPERWAVIAYIHALQLKQGAVKPEELTQDELNQLGAQP